MAVEKPHVSGPKLHASGESGVSLGWDSVGTKPRLSMVAAMPQAVAVIQWDAAIPWAAASPCAAAIPWLAAIPWADAGVKLASFDARS